MLKGSGVVWSGLLFLLLGTAARAEVSASVGGSVRNRLYVFSPLDKDNYSYELNIRPEFTVNVSEDMAAVVTLNAQRLLGAAGRAGNAEVLLVDRAYIDYHFEKWDLRIGRQAINMGSAMIWNPIDLVDLNTPLNFAVQKRGVDTARASISLSPTARVIGAVAFPQNKALSLLRAEWLLGGTGMAVVAVDDRRRDEQVLGVDIKGDLEVGYWLEGAVHLPQEGKVSYRVVVGADYSFPVLQSLTFSAQYYRDSSGGAGLSDYDYEALAAGRRSFLGRQYVSLTGNLSTDEVTYVSLAFIGNLEDRTGLVSLGVGRYFFDNLEVSLRGLLMGGLQGPGEFKPGEGHPLGSALSTRTVELYVDWRF
ncbi:hypothetical protein [Hyalangium minutum]|uniref:hypothetical protein n=1 Tax=Hyalangium minutum TaxID=394096 RepID=UPI0005C6CACA|nr:hypothetical protein [Hyalangium minutum]